MIGSPYVVAIYTLVMTNSTYQTQPNTMQSIDPNQTPGLLSGFTLGPLGFFGGGLLGVCFGGPLYPLKC